MGVDPVVLQTLNASDMSALDRVVGVAMVDDDFRRRLVHERTERLLAPFALSRSVLAWLMLLEARTLEELAQAILACHSGSRNHRSH